MAWNWRKGRSVMGLFRTLVLFYCWSWCKFPFRGFNSQSEDLTSESSRQQERIKVTNHLRCFHNNCYLCLGCRAEADEFEPRTFFPKMVTERLGTIPSSSRPGARCLIFPRQRSNMAETTYISQKRGRLWPEEYGCRSCAGCRSWYFSCCSVMLLGRSSRSQKSQQKSEEFLQGALLLLFFFPSVCSVTL